MTALAAAPTLVTPALAEPDVDALAETVAGRVALAGVDWDFYERVLAAVGDGPQRVTYHRGRLEIELPSKRHEQAKVVIRRLVEAFAEERVVPLLACASTTWKRREIDGGLEADESYYVGDLALTMQGRDLDLAVDPPPNLAVEVDLSSSSVRKEPIYADLGVPEIWRWRADALRCLLRRADDGTYAESADSRALPGFPFGVASDLVRAHAGRLELPAAQALRAWCRANPAAR